MHKHFTIITAVVGVFFSLGVVAQSESKLETKGESFLNKEMYEEALIYFSERDEKTKNENPLYNYYMAMTYYNMPDKKGQSMEYFEAYIENVTPQQMAYYDHYHVYYMLGKIYHLKYRWEDAENMYHTFLTQIHNAVDMMPLERQEITETTQREIEHCKFGRMAVNNPRNVVLESLGDSINTKYPEYASVVSQDESKLIFTSRRPDTRGGEKSKEGGYFEDIYSATLIKGGLFEDKKVRQGKNHGSYFNVITDFEYTNFTRMNDQVNSTDHDGSIQLDRDDQTLFFYRDADIWSIDVGENSEGAEAEKLGVQINSDGYEPSIFYSYDGQKLFIVSNRLGGYGGLDIYVSEKLSEDEWSEPVNLGPKVNTPFDEDAPYFDPDGKTLYFSSKGHSSMGGYDIFRSTETAEDWSNPVNMGFPVNTPADDIYFTMTDRYNRGYYSSSNLGGNGGMDLYRITFSDERDPVAELMGLVKDGDKMVPAKSKITLTSMDGSEEISQATDTLIGDYFLLLGHGKTYTMTVETEGFAPYSKEFVVPEQKEYFQLYQEVHHVHLYDENGNIIGQQITVFNATGEERSSTEYYSDETVRKMNNIKEDQSLDADVLAFSDVKFYMPQDSLRTLMDGDDNLNFDFDGNSDISFLTSRGLDPMDPNSYMIIPSKERNELFPIRGLEIEEEENMALEEHAIKKVHSDIVIDELQFKVQVGVYSRELKLTDYYDVENIEKEKLESGLFKYTSGNFKNYAGAMKLKDEIIERGITDAFITPLHKGVRITMAEAQKIILEHTTESVTR